MVKRRLGDTDTAGLCQSFQPGGDVDAVTINLIFFLDYISEVDADTKLHPSIFRNFFVARFYLFLNSHRALDRIDHTGKLRQQVVTGRVYYPAVVLLDKRFKNLTVGR